MCIVLYIERELYYRLMMNELKEAVSNTLNSIGDSVEKVAFQNHLYGCVVILEQIVEGRGDISGTVFTDDEGDIVDMNGEFDSVGICYGFSGNDRLGYRASDDYKEKWIRIFTEKGINMKELDEFEDAIFRELVEKCKDVPYFEASLATGELNNEWNEKLNGLIHEKLQRRARVVYGKTRRARAKRNITPIHKRTGARKTRRKFRNTM